MIWFISDILLLADMIILAVSSVIISRELFTFTGSLHSGLFTQLHTICAYTGLIIMSIHLGCHWSLILNSFRKSLKISDKSRAFTFISRVFALILVILGIASSFRLHIGSRIIPAHRQPQKNSEQPDKHSHASFSQNSELSDTERDYLSSLTCTGCGRHCSLLYPQCHRGQQQSAEALAEFNNHNEAASETPVIVFDSESPEDLSELFLGYLPISGLYVCGTYYTLKFIRRNKSDTKHI